MTPFSRREFIAAATGATIAARSIAQTTTSTIQEATSPVPPLRWGIIGTGARASHHIPAIQSFPEMRIIAACDVMPTHLDHALKRITTKPTGYSDYHQLLANNDIDAVLICTPNMFHKEMVIAALDAGKHVMCEKPMATTIEDCAAMKAAGAKSNKTVLYTMQLRYSKQYEQMRRLISEGRIGAPKYVSLVEFRGDWNRGDVWQYTDPKSGRKMNWRFSQVASGGTLNEKVCHYFDLINWMMDGTPEAVVCCGGIGVYHDERDTWDHAVTTLKYPGGAKAAHELCMFGPKRLDMQVIGEKASLHLLEDHIMFDPIRGAAEKLPLEAEVKHGERGPSGGIETAVVRMYRDFAQCVASGKKPWMDADKALNSCKVAFLGDRANAQKKAVSWSEI